MKKKRHNGIFDFFPKFDRVMLGVHSLKKTSWGLMIKGSVEGSESNGV